MNNHNPDCERYGPLLSAILDGELDSIEREELLVHVNECSICRTHVREFQQVNLAVATLTQRRDLLEPGPDTLPSLNGVASLSKHKPPVGRTRKTSAWRLIPLAVAATLLVCLGITALPDPDTASAEQIPPEQIVEPMKAFLVNNFQQQHDQELMLRTLGWDLRAMKLEINQLDQGSSERINLESQIDAMIEKVQRFELDTSLVLVED